MDQEKLIKKWLSNELSETEREAFDAIDDAPFYDQIIADAKHFKASNFSKVPDFESFKTAMTAPDPKVRKLNWTQPLLRVAGIAVILFGIYFAFFFNSPTQIQTLTAQKTVISLPDASEVALNARSEITYTKRNWDDNRTIRLEGEAFFDVAKGAKFDVVTPKGTISVLGTEFNVKQRGDLLVVSCYEGTVQVVANGSTNILKVGDRVTLLDGNLETGRNSFPSPQWTKNQSVFQRIPVSEVFLELERQYGLTVSHENIAVDQLFTGGFTHDNLEAALEAISQPLNLDYQILKGTQVRFSKRD